MAFSVWQRTITDAAGNIVSGASIEVRKESDGALATLYADSAGSGLSNPTTSDAGGVGRFYAAADSGGYQVTVSHPSFTSDAVFRNQPVGDAQLRDVGTGADQLLTTSLADARYNAIVLSNTTATTDPTVSNDDTEGYSVGSRWFNTTSDEAFFCLDASTGAAVWAKATLTLDELGSMATRNQGSAAAEHRTNAENEAEFLAKPLEVVEIAGTSYTLTATDNGKMLKTTNASAVTITCPEVATEDLINGFQVEIQRAGDGVVTIQSEGSDVLNAADDFYEIDAKYAAASIVKESDGVYWMTGALANDPILSGYTAPTGTASKAGFATYTAPTITDPPTQAEVQAVADSVEILSQHLKSLIDDLT